MHKNSKIDQVLVKKVKPRHKYCPNGIGTAFSTTFLLDAKA